MSHDDLETPHGFDCCPTCEQILPIEGECVPNCVDLDGWSRTLDRLTQRLRCAMRAYSCGWVDDATLEAQITWGFDFLDWCREGPHLQISPSGGPIGDDECGPGQMDATIVMSRCWAFDATDPAVRPQREAASRQLMRDLAIVLATVRDSCGCPVSLQITVLGWNLSGDQGGRRGFAVRIRLG